MSQAPTQSTTDARADEPQRVVGIGASAGGIAALREVLAGLDAAAPVAYLLLQHTDPARMEGLAKLLAEHCPLPLNVAEDGQLIRPGHVYLVPPDREMRFADELLKLPQAEAPVGPPRGIDDLLSVLAEHYAERAIGVILSGTGMDGVQGMRMIRAAGGITIVQEPLGAEYPGMPQAVIHARLADFTLAARDIGPRIRQVLELIGAEPVAGIETAALSPLLQLLQHKTGFDFGQYKEGTLRRRVARRMLVRGCESVEQYRTTLDSAEDEAAALVRDLLISVTNFFRDSNGFDALRRLLDPLVAQRAAGSEIRVWVPGCATGEEAYSIAITLAELLGDRIHRLKVQLFATDIDGASLQEARLATYRDSALQVVPQKLLDRYFERWDGRYRVRREIRDLIVFAEHDLIRDPPFTRLDLISCRNVLIYFQRPLQERVLGYFHYALRAEGLLLLGNSESADYASELFERADEQAKIYRRRAVEAPPLPSFQPRVPPGAGKSVSTPEMTAEERLRRSLLRDWAPPCVLINRRQDVLVVHGAVEPYLRLPEGRLNINLVDMAVDPQVRGELRVVAGKVLREESRVEGRLLKLPDTEPPRQLQVVGLPGEEDYAVVMFVETAAPQAATRAEQGGTDEGYAELERELAATREHLQANIEDLEAANEELQSRNEEFQSGNEEVQATLEEFQTTYEEMQSTNEELKTVNDELSSKSNALEAANADMRDVLDNVAAAIIVLDADLRVCRYSRASKELFDLWPSTIGRPFIGVGGPLDLSILSHDIHQAAHQREIVERQISLGQREFLVRLSPRTDAEGELSGLVIVFTDETERARTAKQADLLATLVRDSNDAVIVRDLADRILAWNGAAEELFGHSAAQALGQGADILVPEELRSQARLLEQRLIEGEGPLTEITHWRARSGAEREVSVTSSLLRDDQEQPYAIATTVRDLTERKQAERDLIAPIEFAPDPMLVTGADGVIERVNAQAEKLFGYPREELLGQRVEMLLPRQLRAAHRRDRAAYQQEPEARPMGPGRELVCLNRDGREIPVEINLSPIGGKSEPQIAVTLRDVSLQREIQQANRAAREAAERANQIKSRFLAAASHDLRQPLQSLGLYLASVRRENRSGRRSQALDKMEQSLGTMRELLNTLLDLSRLDAGQVEPRTQVFGVQQVLDRVCDLIAPQAEAKGLQLRHRPCSLSVQSDPALLEDLLGNLAFNAVKYTPEGRVVIGCRRHGQRLRIGICDTGPGIAPEHQELIFDEFIQSPDQADEGSRSGLGLGLAIVRRLSELLDHPVDLRSVPGQGSCIWVSVPLARTAAESPVEPPPVASRAAGGGQVLVVDDNESVRDATCQLLELGGYTVAAAADGDAAVMLAAEQHPDLLAVDFHLAGQESGLDVVKRLREEQADPALPAILITGESRAELEAVATEAGCELMLKPVDSDSMLNLISELIARRLDAPD